MIIYNGRKIIRENVGYSVTMPGGEYWYSTKLGVILAALDGLDGDRYAREDELRK